MNNVDNDILNSIDRAKTMWMQVVGVLEKYAIPESRGGIAQEETVTKTVDEILGFADKPWQKQLYESLLRNTVHACTKLEKRGITPDEMAHTLTEIVETVCKVARVIMPLYMSDLSAGALSVMYIEHFLRENKRELDIMIELATMFNLVTLLYRVYSEEGE